eukprot:IDg5685t1
MTDLLAAPSKNFTPDFFISPMYSIRVLHEVAELYDCITIDVDYLSEINLSDYEKSHKSIMTVTWLSYILGQSPSETRSVIDRHKSLRPSSNPVVRSRAQETRQSSATLNAPEILLDNYGLPETENPMLQVPLSLPTTQAVKHEPIPAFESEYKPGLLITDSPHRTSTKPPLHRQNRQNRQAQHEV